MKEKYEEERGETFDEASDIAVRLKVLAGEIYNMQTGAEWLKRQLTPDTATGRFLDSFAQQRGLSRRSAVKAQGLLEFRVSEQPSAAITIPAGTVVSTDSEEPIRVYTVEDGEITRQSTVALVRAEAELPGYRGNISANTATVPVNMPAEIEEVSNLGAFRGGMDAESDITLRARILDSYINRPNGMNAAYYIALATSVEGITKAGVVAKLRGAGTVNVYVCGTDDNVSNETLASVQTLMNRERELNVDVLVARAASRAYDLDMLVKAKAGYDDAEVIAMCTDAFEDYLESIPVGGRLYLAQLGKYLLDTGCIENYEFDVTMQNLSLSGSNFFVAGDIDIEVTR